MGNSVAVVLFDDQNTNPTFNNTLQSLYLSGVDGLTAVFNATVDSEYYNGEWGYPGDYGLPVPSMAFFVRGSDGNWYLADKWSNPTNSAEQIKRKVAELREAEITEGGGGIDPNAGTDLIPGWGGLGKTWLIVAGVALFFILRKKKLNTWTARR